MHKLQKYKKGFTWRHHFDEKWDRLDYSFKLKIQAFFLIFILGVAFLGLAWANQKHEKAQLMKDGATKSEKSQEKDFTSKNRIVSPPPLRHAED